MYQNNTIKCWNYFTRFDFRPHFFLKDLLIVLKIQLIVELESILLRLRGLSGEVEVKALTTGSRRSSETPCILEHTMTSKGHLSHKRLPLSEQRWLSSRWGTSASWHCNPLPLVWLSQIWEGSKPMGLEDR